MLIALYSKGFLREIVHHSGSPTYLQPVPKVCKLSEAEKILDIADEQPIIFRSPEPDALPPPIRIREYRSTGQMYESGFAIIPVYEEV